MKTGSNPDGRTMKILTDKWQPAVLMVDKERDGLTVIVDDGKTAHLFSLKDVLSKINEKPNLGDDKEQESLSVTLLPVKTKILDASPLSDGMHHNMRKMQKELDSMGSNPDKRWASPGK